MECQTTRAEMRMMFRCIISGPEGEWKLFQTTSEKLRIGVQSWSTAALARKRAAKTYVRYQSKKR